MAADFDRPDPRAGRIRHLDQRSEMRIGADLNVFDMGGDRRLAESPVQNDLSGLQPQARVVAIQRLAKRPDSVGARSVNMALTSLGAWRAWRRDCRMYRA